jgi:hypothetical protein
MALVNGPAGAAITREQVGVVPGEYPRAHRGHGVRRGGWVIHIMSLDNHYIGDARPDREDIGLPEARIPLAHATAYMCRAKKSREAYDALNAATEKIEMEQTKRVPEDLKNKHFPVNPER